MLCRKDLVFFLVCRLESAKDPRKEWWSLYQEVMKEIEKRKESTQKNLKKLQQKMHGLKTFDQFNEEAKQIDGGGYDAKEKEPESPG